MVCIITNKKTKVIQLCSNVDIIKSCRQSKDYVVKEVKDKAITVNNEKLETVDRTEGE